MAFFLFADKYGFNVGRELKAVPVDTLVNHWPLVLLNSERGSHRTNRACNTVKAALLDGMSARAEELGEKRVLLELSFYISY